MGQLSFGDGSGIDGAPLTVLAVDHLRDSIKAELVEEEREKKWLLRCACIDAADYDDHVRSRLLLPIGIGTLSFTALATLAM